MAVAVMMDDVVLVGEEVAGQSVLSAGLQTVSVAEVT